VARRSTIPLTCQGLKISLVKAVFARTAAAIRRCQTE